jgi:iron(III) transport system permease protein
MRRPPTALILVAAVPALLVILPIAITLGDAIEAGTTRMFALLWRPLVGDLLVNTVLLTLASVIACVAIGTTAAILVERTDLPARPVWAVLATAPLAVPAFVASYAWVSISPALEGFGGALVVTVFAYAPLVYLPVAASLRGLDPALEDAARTLGDSPMRCLRRVVLPQLRPAILGGALLVALNILVEFGAFALMRFRTFTTESMQPTDRASTAQKRRRWPSCFCCSALLALRRKAGFAGLPIMRASAGAPSGARRRIHSGAGRPSPSQGFLYWRRCRSGYRF